MIPGYNHNIKYKDRVFHVQTEDSGVKNPHIITLLYYGGNILKSEKSTYQDKVNDPGLDAMLPNMMQAQHKTIMKGLVQGKFDTLIEERSANAAFLDGPAPLNVARGQNSTSKAMAAGGSDAPAAPPDVDVFAMDVGSTANAAQPVGKPVEAKPTPPAKTSDGSFSTDGGSMLDAMAKAVPTLDADKLLDALEKGNDDFVFGDANADLGSMMLDFLSKG